MAKLCNHIYHRTRRCQLVIVCRLGALCVQIEISSGANIPFKTPQGPHASRDVKVKDWQ